MTGYVYDAEGNRVAKGNITVLSCDPTANGFTTAGNEKDYILGPGDEQLTEVTQDVDGSIWWQRTYVYAGGSLFATYDPVPDTPNQPLPSFRLTDWLGTLRASTDAYGALQSACDGLPFGNGMACGGNNPDPRYFTGKERDTESGNDYFGARYYGSSMGRFMSPDPSNLSVDWWLPQTWNRYSYGLNNPLSMVDRNGLWPFWIHNEIYDESFPGMSKSDLQNVKDASFVMDFAPGQQEPSSAYMHGMSDGSGTVWYGGLPGEHEHMQGDDFIDQQVQAAKEAQANWIAQGHTGFSPLALSAFGNALHTATDRTSPTHEGDQPWSNKFWPGVWHEVRELRISAPRQDAARNTSRSLFQRTFGNEFDWVFFKNPCARTSATDDKGNTTGWSGCQ